MAPPCPLCDLDRDIADGCSEVPYLHAFVYGAELHFAANDWEPRPRCADCGTRIGFHHHVSCLQARCMLCNGQAAFCDHAVLGAPDHPERALLLDPGFDVDEDAP